MTKWTEPQRYAIADDGGALLVSAAAGSGKTAVMVERAVRLLTDEAHPIAADRLLIATFTRAAAEELRMRIAARLAQAQADAPESVWLRRQRVLLGRASIGTIDSYCMQLLQRYFAELSLPPDFAVADEALALSLREQSLAAALNEAYEDADFCAFADLYGRARSDAPAAEAVERLYTFSRSLPHPERVLARLCADYEADTPLPQTAWGMALLERAKTLATRALASIAAAREILTRHPVLMAYNTAFDGYAAFWVKLRDLADAGEWEKALTFARAFTPPALAAARGVEDAADMRAQTLLKSLRDTVKDCWQTLTSNVLVCTLEEFAQDRAAFAPMLRALVRTVTRFSDLFYETKLAQKVLEYSDLEHLALRLLCAGDGAKSAVAQTVSRGLDAVLVDEYQDTNALQAMLYRCLANDNGSNLFFVGDVKQSIYSFRLASPEIFTQMYESWARYTPGGAHPAVITLAHNFRSAGNVLAQVNDVFSQLMTPQTGGVTYDAGQRLVQGTQDHFDGGAMELCLVETDDESARAGDAQAVAQHITRLVREGYAVRDGAGGTRPCQYGDFCVLLRAHANFPAYEAALIAHGAPVFADTGDSWLASGEVTHMLAALRAIDNPGLDIALTAAMLSPMFCFAPDDLLKIRASAPRGRLYAALLRSTDARVTAFCDTLGTLRRVAACSSVDTLCNELLARTHYLAAVSAMENGAARRENVRSLLRFAAAARDITGGLSAFLRRVDSALAGGRGGTGVPNPPQGSVSIMTIHRSKGLEFPICILADTAHGFNDSDTKRSVLLHPTLGIGAKLRAESSLYTTAPHSAVVLAAQAELVSEELRVLYVALTRAKDKLIVTGAVKNAAKLLEKLAALLAGGAAADSARCFLHWLCMVALRHPDGGLLRELAGAPDLALFDAEGRLSVHVEKAGATEAPEAAAFVRTAQPDQALLQTLRAGFARTPKGLALSELPIKVSVSSIAHGDAPATLSRPAFLYREGLTAAEQGTAQHAFLQFADLPAAAADLPRELARLVDQGYLRADMADKLPLASVQIFLQSPLAERMCAAQTLLREYAFLTATPAQQLMDTPDDLAYTPVLIQGIADAVLLHGDGTAELVDYKTDRRKTPADFLRAYTKQLSLYKNAIEKRLSVRVTKMTIYSFTLHAEIDVPPQLTRVK